MRIKVVRNTSVSGKSVSVGTILSVPADISAQNAKTLLSLHKAIEIKEPVEVKEAEKNKTKEKGGK